MHVLQEYFNYLGIDIYVATAGLVGFVMSFLSSKKQRLIVKIADACICGFVSCSLVPVVAYIELLPNNCAMFIGVTIGSIGADSIRYFFVNIAYCKVMAFIKKDDANVH